MKIFKHSIFISLLCLSLFCSSCKAKQIDLSGKFKIVTTIFPLFEWTHNLSYADNNTADNKILTLLVKNGIDLHSYQPSVAEISQISNADLFIYVGGESDYWVKNALSQASNKNMIVINLMDVLKDHLKEEESFIGDSQEGEEECEIEEEMEYDEHVWLSVKNAKICVQAISQALISADPQNKELYNRRLADYMNKLNALDLSFEKDLKAMPKDTLIVCDRFPFKYLFDDYGIKYYAAFKGCSAETEASFETVSFLSNKVSEIDAKAVLVTESSDKKLAKTIIYNSENKFADIYVIDSLQSTSLREAFNGKTYLASMYANLTNIKKALE
ncbi:MAG: metal ABC transporter substrate-binding protein [Treponema sp.]|nr:metal ABC transporter substrate-binding protein [Treponema sp.]